ncbi:MAG: hypothetical protein ACM3UZ_16245 [Acidobacteriota bacterium]
MDLSGLPGYVWIIAAIIAVVLAIKIVHKIVKIVFTVGALLIIAYYFMNYLGT